ncbi:MAG TPA: hypothetical protein VIF88_04125 [Methylocystis sp.]|jgi:hypothetical protein
MKNSRKLLTTALAATMLLGAVSVATPASAWSRWGGGGWGGGGWGRHWGYGGGWGRGGYWGSGAGLGLGVAGLATGLALGAATSPYGYGYYGSGYPGYYGAAAPAYYGYGGGCTCW